MIVTSFWACLVLAIVSSILFSYHWIAFFKSMGSKSFPSPSDMQSSFGKLIFGHVAFGFLTMMLLLASIVLGIIWIVQKFS